MKRFGYVVLSAMIWMFVSCEEEPPILRKAEKPLLDTAYLMGAPSAEPKRVWLADITGVKCTNCPEAAEIAHQIYKDNPGRVELIALYPTFFPSLTGRVYSSKLYSGSKLDLTCPTVSFKASVNLLKSSL